MRWLVAIAVFLSLSLNGTAAEFDTLAVANHASLWNKSVAEAQSNPSMLSSAYAKSLSTIGLQYDISRMQEAYVPQNGDGFSLFRLSADSYLRLSPTSAVAGNASYSTGLKQNVRWNSTADYDLLYPYIMADTLGGDLSTEYYSFAGSYATRLGRFGVGADVSYRAGHEYRSIDPRPHNIVSDLDARVGASLPVGNSVVGLGFGVSIYRQTNDVDFYNEAGAAAEYQLTGLGTYYKRFAGSASSLYYKGSGGSLELFVSPSDVAGVFASISAGRKSFQCIITTLNHLPINTLRVDDVRAKVGWRGVGHFNWVAEMGGEYAARLGTEHIAGSASSSNYPIIADLLMYKHRTYSAYLSGMVGQTLPRRSWYLRSTAKAISSKAEYVYPKRSQEIVRLHGGIEGQLIHRLGDNLLLTWNAWMSYSPVLSSSLNLPLADMEHWTIEMETDSHRYQASDYTKAGGSVRSDFRRKPWTIGIFAEIGAEKTLCSEGENATLLHLAAGIAF